MKIKELSLENFRNAQKVKFCDELAFDDQFNIFYGVNGAGKSTILVAITKLLSFLPARLKTPNGNGIFIEERDIRNGSQFCKIELTTDTNHTWSLVKNRSGRQNHDLKGEYTGVNELSKELSERNPPHYPVLVSYLVTRQFLDIPARIRTRHNFNDRLATYENTFRAAADFRLFFEWFRNLEDIENENFRLTGNLQKSRQLEAVRDAITKFIPDISNLTVKRGTPQRMEVIKNNKIFNIDQLSDGEKCLITMIGDLARRLAIANPSPNDDPLNGDGIVLIDEVDLHLHPEWQCSIIDRLSHTFPNCQFFISTHSPLVLNQLSPEHLFLLKKNMDGLAVERPSESYGKNSTRILEDLMGLETTHNHDVSKRLKNIFELIDQNDFANAQNRITELRDIGFNDPELKSAEMLIRRKEYFSK